MEQRRTENPERAKWKMVIKATVFVGLVSLLSGVVFRISADLARARSHWHLDSQATWVILGHSHAECAYMDTLDPRLVNLAQSGESYFYTWQKLKVLLAHNPDITDIYIEFTNNQIDPEMDAWIWSDKYIQYRYPLYAPYIDASDALYLARHNTSGYLVAFTSAIKENALTVLQGGVQNWGRYGGFLGLDKVLTEDGGARFDAVDLPDEGGRVRYSDANLRYLERIVAHCADARVRVHLVRSPQHASYSLSNEAAYQSIRQQRFPDVPYLDYGQFDLADTLFADREHLNEGGAQRYTQAFLADLGKAVAY